MVAQAPGVFFREWLRRNPGERRDIGRAADLLAVLGLPAPDTPVLAVVGSKGKGTCAAYASATLAAAGARVVTVTSPGVRGPRDRVRLGGRAVGESDLARLAHKLDEAAGRLPPPRSGYLSPSGLFLAAGALYAREQGADLLVMEAGMGGRGDEVRLFDPAAVALTTVFGEHLGVLGDTVAQIAEEKAGAAGPGTRAFVHGPLEPGAEAAAHAALGARTGGRVLPERLEPGTAGVGDPVLPDGLGRPAAELGCASARRLLATLGREEPEPERLRRVLASVRLPGRLSHHVLARPADSAEAGAGPATAPCAGNSPGTRPASAGAVAAAAAAAAPTELVVDSAIERAGAAAALEHARRRWGGVDHVLVCLPDHKDVEGAVAALAGERVTAAALPDAHLSFSAALPADWGRVRAEEVTPQLLAGLGRRVLVLGTVYFTGRVLDAIGADTDSLFTA
ncbi:hypothetical protein [Streptomonospora wellingtoniae]|uniref:Bifunctional folylpolyglutamate synthase/dihydrofolate synthase n=1 Tax=Streptomonospora wellingtoniae TaxID=3075544 RepID=A0ABU2KS65_9ACTN|nr:hypothetical protein [Streptomonospora sp. DSM 45055]MDT0302017.1 hypothetical protein [Streptomonospora sp. DSM 45055]